MARLKKLTIPVLENGTVTNKTYDLGEEGIVSVDSAIDGTSTNPVQNKVIKVALDDKVDKDGNKVLSTNDYTTSEKNKLAGIATGAEVNVQSDWDITDNTSDAYIKNKPTSKAASSGGSDISLVTTGEKYTWNNKSSLALGETSSTAYRGDRGKTAYDHSQVTSGNPHSVTKTDVGLGNVPNVATNDQTPTFSVASTRANIASGEKLSVIFGKIMKFFTDLKTVAFSGSYSDLSDKPTIPAGTVTSVTLKATSPIAIDSSSAITSSGTRTLSHANSGATAGSYGDSSAQTPSHGGTFKVPYVEVNATGHVTGISEHTVTLPASGNTDSKVTQTATSTNADYEVLFSSTADNTTRTEGARKYSNLKFNPSTGNLQATQLNGVNIGSSPKFTDTTYSAATTSANGLMSSTDKSKLDKIGGVYYGTCSTAAATAAKVISVDSMFELKSGATIVIKFSYTNSASNPTFNVNSKGAKSVWYNTAAITTSSLGYAGTASRPSIYTYDGTYWIFVGWSYDANTTYSSMTASEATEGTGTGTRVITPAILKSAIQTHSSSSDMIATIQTSLTASRAYAIGQQFIYNGGLYKATAAISSGGTITIGSSGNAIAADNIADQIYSNMPTYSGASNSYNVPTSWGYTGFSVKIPKGCMAVIQGVQVYGNAKPKGLRLSTSNTVSYDNYIAEVNNGETFAGTIQTVTGIYTATSSDAYIYLWACAVNAGVNPVTIRACIIPMR